EARAYDYVVRFANSVPEASFRAGARKDLTFGHLLSPESNKYRGETVLVEGRLKRIRDIKPTAVLSADGIEHLYEGWIRSDVHPDYFWCVLFTELPAELQVAEELDQRVTFVGYFFKVYRYAVKDGARRSPMLIGHTIAAMPQTLVDPWN